VAISNLLKNGKPMIDFESLKELFEFLKFVNAPQKHWIDSSEWGMARALHSVVLKQMKMVLQQKFFISINCDEITTLDNQSWISMHVYLVENWRRQPILLNFEKLWKEAHLIILILLLFVFLLIWVVCQWLMLLTRWYVLGLLV
jgi:hypothetical protein